LNKKPNLSLGVISNPSFNTKGISYSSLRIKPKCISYRRDFATAPYIRKSTSCIYPSLSYGKPKAIKIKLGVFKPNRFYLPIAMKFLYSTY